MKNDEDDKKSGFLPGTLYWNDHDAWKDERCEDFILVLDQIANRDSYFGDRHRVLYEGKSQLILTTTLLEFWKEFK